MDFILAKKNSFYHILKPHHELAVGEGEKSQGDNSKTKSVWNNLKAQMWTLRCFVDDHRVLWNYELIWC